MDAPPNTEPLSRSESGEPSQAWAAHFQAAAMRAKKNEQRLAAVEAAVPAEVTRATAAEAALSPTPGSLLAAAFEGTIPGYARADGGTVSRTANPVLFARFGTAYGAGDGTTTFNVPNIANDGTSAWRRWYVKLDP